MTRIAYDIKRASLLELGMAFHVKATFLRTIGDISKGVGSAINHLNINAFAVLDVDGGAAVHWGSVGQREATQLNGSLERARHIKLAVS